MKKLALIAAVLAVVVPAASAGRTHRTSVAVMLAPQSVRLVATRVAVPDLANTSVVVSVKDKPLGTVAADSSRQIELAGHGVLAVAWVTKKMGPAYVRLASVRTAPVLVRIVFRW